ncbi:MAG: type I restriction endonuclease subunit R [Algicola sp.]|nr:type I restriction endonuclease subunit R [Algicola sp.]
MKKFTEATLEAAIMQLFSEQGYDHVTGAQLAGLNQRTTADVLLKDDLRAYLAKQYQQDNITAGEIDSVILQLEALPAHDLYASNKQFCRWLSDGFALKREASSQPGMASQKDLHIQLIDYTNVELQLLAATAIVEQPEMISDAVNLIDDNIYAISPANTGIESKDTSPTPYYTTPDNNIYKIVNQLAIARTEGDPLIPDGVLYINGLPIVVFEFKSTVRKEATIHDAYRQLTKRYHREIPQLFVYNAFCVISDGVNSKMGGFFSPYEFFYAWRKVTGNEPMAKDGVASLHTMVQGLFDFARLRDVVRHFIHFPDTSKAEVKIVCRYPQYYAANKLLKNIEEHRKPDGDGKGGTYFGATGCGKSYTMLFLARLLMKSLRFASPTNVLITDRTDLDEQLSKQFTDAKDYIGDQLIVSIKTREHLRELLQGRNSGGVFLTTIQKFSEDTLELTPRSNVICISDEAHRSQINLDKKITITEADVTTNTAASVKQSYGFAKHLHDALPNATYVGFSGTPIDGTLAVFGPVVDSYTMNESVKDEITVPIIYEGRAAKVILDNSKLEDIEAYYKQCETDGSNEFQIEESKKATANINAILGDPDRIRVLAKDFVAHYEKRVEEGATIKGKALFVCSSRGIAYQLYQELKLLRPLWFEVLECEAGVTLTDQEREKIKPVEQVKMVMTRTSDDDKVLYEILGAKEYRKALANQFKDEKSNFKISIVVDMWLTGFDVPFLDSIYIDKPLQQHNLIQTISRVNRKCANKNKGLVVDYIGIKTHMDKAMQQFSKIDQDNIEDVAAAIVVVKDHLDLLAKLFHGFDNSAYFNGDPLAQYNCLGMAAEFAIQTNVRQQRFMALVKRLKAAYDVCCGCEAISEIERDHIYYYLAVRTVVYKLTKGEAPDTEQMNKKVRDMIAEALKSDGVSEIFKLGNDDGVAIDIFNDDYVEKISKVKLPHTKIKLLEKLLAQAIGDFKKVNHSQGTDFSRRFKGLVDKYNERKEETVLTSDVLEDFSDQLVDFFGDVKGAVLSYEDMDIDQQEKAFYDILKSLAVKYDFSYPEDKTIELAKAVKVIVDDKAKFPDWSKRADIKADLRVSLIILLAKYKYPPITHDDVYREIFTQAENAKKNSELK